MSAKPYMSPYDIPRKQIQGLGSSTKYTKNISQVPFQAGFERAHRFTTLEGAHHLHFGSTKKGIPGRELQLTFFFAMERYQNFGHLLAQM